MDSPANQIKSNNWLSIGIALALSAFRVWAGWLWTTQLGWKWPWLGAGGFGCDAYRFNVPAGQTVVAGETGLHGLCDWMQREVNYPFIGLYADFVKNIVIPNFDFFAWLTFFTEGFIALSLILGFLTRLGGFLGTFWGLSLLIGLLNVPGESLGIFLPYIIPPAVFMVIGARNQFSVDAWLGKRYEQWAGRNRVGRLVKFASGAKPGSAGVV